MREWRRYSMTPPRPDSRALALQWAEGLPEACCWPMPSHPSSTPEPASPGLSQGGHSGKLSSSPHSRPHLHPHPCLHHQPGNCIRCSGVPVGLSVLSWTVGPLVFQLWKSVILYSSCLPGQERTVGTGILVITISYSAGVLLPVKHPLETLKSAPPWATDTPADPIKHSLKSCSQLHPPGRTVLPLWAPVSRDKIIEPINSWKTEAPDRRGWPRPPQQALLPHPILDCLGGSRGAGLCAVPSPIPHCVPSQVQKAAAPSQVTLHPAISVRGLFFCVSCSFCLGGCLTLLRALPKEVGMALKVLSPGQHRALSSWSRGQASLLRGPRSIHSLPHQLFLY
ncbi:uncharacterized protein LOC115835523 [Nomascus leucogenys]|uniref:uncharacterized protein LOC115835523 n=1 Tax=Nomascus leucogenys TaxID=61853 RepID=UPI00122DBFE6|nr:uncharacterized protein LOC115835523 [Nomascus leucogenys]XP_030670723.1 uncharacterized protein LOC115835523 [Nomascus leucogenys]XP_030670724.1 uncharacterized protein LOC115835523 [Nomascus leucogenys]